MSQVDEEVDFFFSHFSMFRKQTHCNEIQCLIQIVIFFYIKAFVIALRSALKKINLIFLLVKIIFKILWTNDSNWRILLVSSFTSVLSESGKQLEMDSPGQLTWPTPQERNFYSKNFLYLPKKNNFLCSKKKLVILPKKMSYTCPQKA